MNTARTNAHAMGKMLLRDNNWDSGICAYGAVSEGSLGGWNRTAENADIKDGVATSAYRLSSECHASMSDMWDAEVKVRPEYVVDVRYPQGRELTNHMVKEWYRYILLSSPYSKAFAEDDIEAGWRRGYYLYHANANHKLLVTALIAVRMASEYPEYVRRWYELYDAGVDVDMAYIASYFVSDMNSFEVIVESKESHVPIIPMYMTPKSVFAYMDGDYDKANGWADKGYYDNIHSNFKSDSDHNDCFVLDIHKKYNKAIKDARQEEAEKRVAIFNHAWNVLEHKHVTKEEGMPILKEILNQFTEEVINNA